jgi:hypothetical protein
VSELNEGIFAGPVTGSVVFIMGSEGSLTSMTATPEIEARTRPTERGILSDSVGRVRQNRPPATARSECSPDSRGLELAIPVRVLLEDLHEDASLLVERRRQDGRSSTVHIEFALALEIADDDPAGPRDVEQALAVRRERRTSTGSVRGVSGRRVAILEHRAATSDGIHHDQPISLDHCDMASLRIARDEEGGGASRRVVCDHLREV